MTPSKNSVVAVGNNIPPMPPTVNTQNQKFNFGDPLYEKRGRGYVGSSMSVNVRAAYVFSSNLFYILYIIYFRPITAFQKL